MKKYTYIVIALVLGTINCFADADPLAPTGLTIVVTDSANRVLDTVAVVDDKESRSVTFKLPKNLDEIRVFAIGSRLHKDFPKRYFIKGRPQDKKWMGLGYVEAHIEKGVLVAVDGNGAGPMKLSDTIKAAIKKDLKDAELAAITTVKTVPNKDLDERIDMSKAKELKPVEPSGAMKTAIEKALQGEAIPIK